MDYRVVVIIGAALAAASIQLLPACSAPDPGQITFVPRTGASNPADENGDQSSSGNLPPSTSSSSSSTGGTTPTADPVFGTDAFAFTDPGETANGQPAPHAPPMQGKECVSAGCHADPAAAGPKWLAAGTVYGDINGGPLTAGSQFEIRIVLPDGGAFGGGSFSPDTDGNFWLDPGAVQGGIPEGSKVGIRKGDGGAPKDMSDALTNATGSDCAASACHGSATNRIYAP